MGHDKRLLPDGTASAKPLLLRGYEMLHSVFDRPWVLANDAPVLGALLEPGARVMRDTRPGSGPLSALADALVVLDRPWALLLAVDVPLVDGRLLQQLDERRRSAGDAVDVFVPRARGIAQVTCAFYRCEMAPRLIAARNAGELSLAHWVATLGDRARTVDVDDIDGGRWSSSFLNLNTAEEYQSFLRSG